MVNLMTCIKKLQDMIKFIFLIRNHNATSVTKMYCVKTKMYIVPRFERYVKPIAQYRIISKKSHMSPYETILHSLSLQHVSCVRQWNQFAVSQLNG